MASKSQADRRELKRVAEELAYAQASWAGGGHPDDYNEAVAYADGCGAALAELINHASHRALRSALAKGEAAQARSLKKLEAKGRALARGRSVKWEP